jgi:hypothetical protein
MVALKKGNSEQLEMNLNSKFEDLKKLFASLEDFHLLKNKVEDNEKVSNDHGRKLVRLH